MREVGGEKSRRERVGQCRARDSCPGRDYYIVRVGSCDGGWDVLRPQSEDKGGGGVDTPCARAVKGASYTGAHRSDCQARYNTVKLRRQHRTDRTDTHTTHIYPSSLSVLMRVG